MSFPKVKIKINNRDNGYDRTNDDKICFQGKHGIKRLLFIYFYQKHPVDIPEVFKGGIGVEYGDIAVIFYDFYIRMPRKRFFRCLCVNFQF